MNLTAWNIIADICIDLRMVGMSGDPFLVPRCNVQQDYCSQDCYQCEPPDGTLSEGQNYERCQKRPERISSVASYLKYRLRQAAGKIGINDPDLRKSAARSRVTYLEKVKKKES